MSFGIVGEFGLNYDSGEGISGTLMNFLGGVRFSSRSAARFTPYVEGLGGLVRTTITIGDVSTSVTDPAIQGGGGVDLKISDSASLRAGLDYRVFFTEGSTTSALRLRAGLVVGFGGTTGGGSGGPATTPMIQQPRPTPAPPPPAPVMPVRAISTRRPRPAGLLARR